jgi:hypothetical protein
MDLNELIARKAYELWETSGRIEGRDVDNWLQAEEIVLKTNPEPESTEQEKKTKPKRK